MDGDTGFDGGGGGSGADGGGVACDPAQVPSTGSYEGPKIWTSANYAANDTACRDLCDVTTDPQCVAEKCLDGALAFYACLGIEQFDCLTQPGGGACRSEWESEFCCVSDECGAVPEAQLEACIMGSCGAKIDATNACAEQNPDPCTANALSLCLAEEVPPDAGATEAGLAPNVARYTRPLHVRTVAR